MLTVAKVHQGASSFDTMQPFLSPAQELDDEISMARRLRRMKRRLLLGVSSRGTQTPPVTPSRAVRTVVNKRHSLNITPSSSFEPPTTPRSEDNDDISKDLSIRSDPGPYFSHPHASDTNVSVRKLRRIKRRLFLEQLTSNATVPPTIATRSVSEPVAMTPKNRKMIHDELQVASEIVNNDEDVVSPLPSPRLSATTLRRIKRRLFLDHLESRDLDINKMCAEDDAFLPPQKVRSSTLEQGAFMDAGALPYAPHLMLNSWSAKVEHTRRLSGEPPMQLRSPKKSHHLHQRLKKPDDPQAPTLADELSSKLKFVPQPRTRQI